MAALLGAVVAFGAAIDLATAATVRPGPAVVRTDYTTPPCQRRSPGPARPSHRAAPPGRRTTWHCHAPRPAHPGRSAPRERAR
nr:hypothetical protein GCM10020063_039100 [Dactylosporangium thailandense]